MLLEIYFLVNILIIIVSFIVLNANWTAVCISFISLRSLNVENICFTCHLPSLKESDNGNIYINIQYFTIWIIKMTFIQFYSFRSWKRITLTNFQIFFPLYFTFFDRDTSQIIDDIHNGELHHRSFIWEEG